MVQCYRYNANNAQLGDNNVWMEKVRNVYASRQIVYSLEIFTLYQFDLKITPYGSNQNIN